MKETFKGKHQIEAIDGPQPVDRLFKTLDRETLGFDVGSNVSFVTEQSMCTGCGTCVAVCPEAAIEMQYHVSHGMLEAVVDTAACTECERCVEVCPGFELDLTRFPREHRLSKQHHQVGPYIGIWRSYSYDTDMRRRASSGGIITELLRFLFARGYIQAAIVTRMQVNSPLDAEAYIAWSADELLASQKSKYCPNALNTILRDLVTNRYPGKTFAYMGLPSHVHGLRLLQEMYPHLRESIVWVFSSFTAHVPSRRATEFLLHTLDVAEQDVKRIEYRSGGVPGHFSVELHNGETKQIPHLHWTYYGHAFAQFFYPAREWLYYDKLSIWADISLGDNWQAWTGEPMGASTVVTRNQRSEALFKKLIDTGNIFTSPMTVEELVVDQGLNKKLYIGPRHKVWAMLGRKVPLFRPELPWEKHDIPRTLRFAFYVMLCERKVPFTLLKSFIHLDFIFRKQLPLLIKEGFSALRVKRITGHITSQRPKIVMIGGFGYKDIGDEAMPHADRLNLRQVLNNQLTLVMLSPDPAYTRIAHEENSIADVKGLGLPPNSTYLRKFQWLILAGSFLFAAWLRRVNLRMNLWRTASEVLDELSTADLVFNVGGGNLTSMIPQELYKKCVVYLACKILRKPVVISGQTIGPFTNRWDKIVARIALNTVRMITFRDKQVSMNRTRDIGVNRPKMVDAADDAITIPHISEDEAVELIQRTMGSGTSWISTPKPLVVFLNLKASLKVFKVAGVDTDIKRESNLLAKIADRLVAEYQAWVYFMPTDFHVGVDDRDLHRQIFQQMLRHENVYLLEEEYTDKQIKGMIGLADLAVGARYHFNVFAAAMKVPFLGIASGTYQRTKLQGLANLCQLPHCYFDEDMETVDMDDVWKRLVSIIDNRQKIRTQLETRIPVLEENSLIAVREAAKIIKQQRNIVINKGNMTFEE